jgi:hypothetical protein
MSDATEAIATLPFVRAKLTSCCADPNLLVRKRKLTCAMTQGNT